MKFALMLTILLLSGCSLRDHAAEKKELDRLAECVCQSKGGYSYMRYYDRRAKVVCHQGDTTYELVLGDVCRLAPQ